MIPLYLGPHRVGGSQMPFQSLVRRRPGPAPEVPIQGVKQNRAPAPGLEDSGHTDAEHPNKSDFSKAGLSFLICKMGVHAVTTTGTLTWRTCTEMLIPCRDLTHSQQSLTQVTSHSDPWELVPLLILADQPLPRTARKVSVPGTHFERAITEAGGEKSQRKNKCSQEAEWRSWEEERVVARGHEGPVGPCGPGFRVSGETQAKKPSCTP